MKTASLALCTIALLAACATRQPDHFHVLSPQPAGAGNAQSGTRTLISLSVTLPSVIDRPEMVLNTSADGIVVLEHERWAAPLTDLVSQALARDIERRRSGLLVADRSFNVNGAPAAKITVAVVQVLAHKGGSAVMETHWRILDTHTGKESLGGEVFSAPLAADGYAALPQSLSDCLGQLADRLAAQLPGS